jgi:cytoskeletal protein RodZ
MSLRQISNTTKISVASLEALERDDISRLPGGIFSRAFVRSYAIEVGLDPEKTIQDFLAQFPHDSVLAGHPASNGTDENEKQEINRRMFSVFVRLLAISLPLGGLILYLSGAGPAVGPDIPAAHDEAAAEVPAAVPPPAQPEPAATSTSMPEATPAVTMVEGRPAEDDLLTVVLAATAPCWVLAIDDGEPVLARELGAGEREVLEVSGLLVLTIGDASAVRLMLNGVEARSLGRPGQVVTLRLTPANFRTYLPTP